MKVRRIKAMARKELLHILRDPLSLGLALLIPLLMLLLFGYTLSLDVDRIPTRVVDRDGTPTSRALWSRFDGSRYFNVKAVTPDDRNLNAEIDRGSVLLAVVIPAGFERDLLLRHQPAVQLLLDASDSNTASIALNYAESLVSTWSLERTLTLAQRAGIPPRQIPLSPEVRVWYNEDLKSRNYIIPGLIAVVLMIIAALLTSLTIAREWENGSMEQLLSTPLRPAEIVLGKLSAYFAIGAADMVTSILASIFVFDIPLRGNLFFLAFSSGIFLFGALSWGVFVSAVARSQLLAYQIGMMTSFLPAFLLSGFIYAIENMPYLIQAVTYIVPARYFVVVVKTIYLKGEGISLLWPQVLFLAAYAVIVFFAATRKVGRKLAA